VAKNIILLSDGTGNSAAKVWRTNVWRLFQCLDLKDSNQIAIYDDGVGTSSFLPLAILGGAFGYGLKRNVLDLYKFLCRNYQPGEDFLDREPPPQSDALRANPKGFAIPDAESIGESLKSKRDGEQQTDLVGR
jgi:hypothetical protein